MKILFYFIIFNSFVMKCLGQVESSSNITFNNKLYNYFIVKVEPENIKKFDILENRIPDKHQDFLLGLSDTLCFLTNASISDPNCKPIGLFIKNGQTVHSTNLNDGTGNFYLKPNGALLFTSSDAIICESSKINNIHDIQLGIQSGPLLLNNGSVNPNFRQNSPNLQIRSGVGIYNNNRNEKFIVFAISNEPVSFYDFSTFFIQKFQCKMALCLESVGCSMFFPNQEGSNRNFNNIICNYLYFKI